VGLLLAVCALPVAQADARRITFGQRDLRQGMRGHDVRVLQSFLTKYGVRTTVDGQYGRRTASSVRSWESASALPVDGRVSRQDAATLRGQVEQGASSLQGAAAPVAVAAPGPNATLGADGRAIAPAGAPPQVVAVIAAANAIVGKPYRYGGGHGVWNDSGYDCSGSESFALHGAGLVSRPMNSTEFMSWGDAGTGQWITSYANSGHSYLVVAACDSTRAGTTRPAPARSGRRSCGRPTPTPRATPPISET